MKIVIVAPEEIPVPPIRGGSVEITIMGIARKLVHQHSVTIVSRSHRRYPKHSIHDGIHIYRVPSGDSLTYLSHVKRFLQGRKFDILQIENRPKFVGPLRTMFPNANIVLFLHSLTFVSPPYSSRTKAGEGLSKANLIIVNSSSLQNRIIQKFPNVKDKVRKTWLGVDTSRFTPAYKNSSNGATLLFAGRLIPRKGVPVLLEAAKLVQKRISRPVKVIIAGGSSKRAYTKRLKSLAHSLHVQTRFLGTIPHHRIHRIYKQADVFVCPSQKHEAFGLVNVEAMASGLPVVASDNGGIREIIENGQTGFLVKDYHKAEAFVDAIVRILTNKELHDKMKIAARSAAVKKFGWAATANRLNEIYTSIKEK
ncbi:glycosyltransferase family 4 protein [Paenibacillus ginsengarvi]|uniref:Glycosyltransferase family 1 protein n=1 Tax=Paenibacillus ginsengarvi TaxID=400777 RepID=A0A3B0BQ43_9BACL|nr:glycosyltransferase family 4 protein [Paenibacillus ginsengarvi]RKN74920.1 glycosyltransferase family 1 protein [Paenibacillus ginsengarvi]